MKLLAIFILLVLTIAVRGQSLIIYEQKVKRDDLIKVEGFKSRRGLISLTEDSLRFIILDKRPTQLNFRLAYSEIKSINIFFGFLLPNRIKIKTWDGNSYRLFTYKKKEILRITKSKLKTDQGTAFINQ